jgi:hypothetical protein
MCLVKGTFSRVPAKEPSSNFKVGDKIRVNLQDGKIEDAVVRAVIRDADGIKLQWMLSVSTSRR